MNCTTCGERLAENARFCGGCGTVLAPPAVATASTPPPGATIAPEDLPLARSLLSLREGLRESGTPSFLLDAITRLAAGPTSGGHLTAICGEKGRGKSTLVNRLLGTIVLPVGRAGSLSSVSLRSGDTWRVHGEDGALRSFVPPLKPEEGARVVEGPSPVLASTTLLDTPGLNQIGLDFEERVVGELVHADAFLICVAANQLLSQQERELIRGRLLPMLGGEGALVVSNMDFLESDEDRASVQARARKFAGDRLPVFFLPADRSGRAPEVEEFLASSAAKWRAAQGGGWRRKAGALLRGLEGELAALPDTSVEVDQEPTREERLSSLRTLLASEHSLALSEAEAELRGRLASLRVSLSDRVSKWTPEHARNEGMTEVAAELHASLRAAAELYARSLERSLSSGAPRTLQLVATGVTIDEERLAIGGSPASPPIADGAARGRDLRAPLVAAGGVAALLFISGPLAPIVAGAAVWTAVRMRATQAAELEAQLRTDAAGALSSWIANSESELVAQLRAAARDVPGKLMEQAAALIDSTPKPKRPATRAALLDQVRACLALAEGGSALAATSQTETK